MKKYFSFFLALLVAFSSMSFAATWDLMWKPISKAEIEKAFVNKTWYSLPRDVGKTMPSNQFMGSLDDQGHFYGRFSQPLKEGPQADVGTIQIKDNGEICYKFPHWDEGKELCNFIYETKDAYIAVGTEGALRSVILKKDITSGNQLKKN